jgi:type I restriction enzyme S subunit
MDEVPAIDVRPDLWAIVRDILRGQVPRYEVWAFGSRVTGKTKRYSDLDLAIIGDVALPLAVRAELEDAFSESDLPWRVDVVDWATTSATFRAIIIRDKVVVQRANAQASAETVKQTR